METILIPVSLSVLDLLCGIEVHSNAKILELCSTQYYNRGQPDELCDDIYTSQFSPVPYFCLLISSFF